MYSPKERDNYFKTMTEKIATSESIEGIVQIGSGVTSYTDKYSDIDLMVAAYNKKDVNLVKIAIHQFFTQLKPIYIKEKEFSKDIFLLIVLLENKLEFNVSIVRTELLSVKSPLWNVIVDKTGFVTKKMQHENELFENKDEKYEVGFDLPSEFVYCAISLDKALKRNNVIYALKMLEDMRSYLLILQGLNEKKKLHQFKAYDSLSPAFIESFLLTYPGTTTAKDIKTAAQRLTKLFETVIEQSPNFCVEPALLSILQ